MGEGLVALLFLVFWLLYSVVLCCRPPDALVLLLLLLLLYLPIFPSFRPMGMVGEACLPSNTYYPRTPDYTLCSGVHVCWSEHSDSSFVYGFMSLDYGFGTMTATTYTIFEPRVPNLYHYYAQQITNTLKP